MVVIMDINEIKKLCQDEALRWTNHIHIRIQQRGIAIDDVMFAIMNSKIIEEYPADYPFPSCLLFGLTSGNEPLHIVCGVGSGEFWLITAYHPNNEEWALNFTVRKELI